MQYHEKYGIQKNLLEARLARQDKQEKNDISTELVAL